MLSDPALLRPVFAALRRISPILTLGKRVVVSRHADIVEVLDRDEDFTIAEVNAERMARWSGPFILGMDRGEVFDRESAALRRAVPRTDLPRIRTFVAENATQLLDAAQRQGRVDVANGYARVVAARLVAEYFGVPGPDLGTTMRWMRAIFDVVFIDEGPRARQAATITVAEQKPYMDALIASRRADVEADRPVPDDVLTRLVAMRPSEPWLDDDAVRRNINGIIVGAVDTTSKAVTHVVHELLRHPKAMEGARQAAVAGDIDAVHGYAWDALRFRPHGPVLERYCGKDTTLGPGGTRIRAGSTVLVAVLSGMFDGDAFPRPGELRSGRPLDRYLHFGYGMHTCFGLAINGVQIPELVAALLRLPNLRRASGAEGRLVYDGPFPDRLVVAFGPEAGP
ncbi:MAG: cytochrome P450 [Actinomycetota bacterium]|nr:cytochrome P450 [Actinomycetota bacterium]